MWLLKSPKDGNSVNLKDFINDCMQCGQGFNEIRKVYEILTYIRQKDEALIQISRKYGLDLPYKLYTYSFGHLELLHTNKELLIDEERFISTVADKVERIEKEITSCTGEECDFFTYRSWEVFTPKQPIIGYYNSLKMKFDFFKSDYKKIIEIYEITTNELYIEQQNLAIQIFSCTDENDINSLVKLYEHVKALVINGKYYIDYVLNLIDDYKILKEHFPMIRNDIYLLINEGEINNKKPYIKIIDNKFLKWNSTNSCLAKYFYYLHKTINDKKNVNWDFIKNILFTDLTKEERKKINLRNYTNKEYDQETYDLFAKLKSFEYLYQDKKLPDIIDSGDINEIKTRNNKLHPKFDNYEIFFEGRYITDDNLYKF